MAQTDWRQLRADDLPGLREARLQAHHGAQWLARAARACLPPRPDDSHLNLGWNAAHARLESHPLIGDWRLSLDIAANALGWAGGEGGAAFALDGHTNSEAHAWLRGTLTAMGRDGAALPIDSAYDLPEHAVAKGGRYGGAGLAQARAMLSAWFALADQTCARARGLLTARGRAAPAARCWPHHFDLATLSVYPTPAGAGTAYVGAGFSPGDGYYEQPYFYVSLYPAPDAATLPALPEAGAWHTHEFNAGVATASKLVATPDPAAALDEFIRAAIDAVLEALPAKA